MVLVAIGKWQKQAACHGLKLLFEFNPRQAMKICKSCPVADQCLKYALIYGEYGIWGGTTREARVQLIQDQPLIRLRLIQEAKSLGLYEYRYTVDQYWKELKRARSPGPGQSQ